MRATFFSFLIIAALFGTANAVEPDEVLADLALEATAGTITMAITLLASASSLELLEQHLAVAHEAGRLLHRSRLPRSLAKLALVTADSVDTLELHDAPNTS